MIVPVMAISNLVLTQQIYSEETNGAHAHYREPVPLIKPFHESMIMRCALEKHLFSENNPLRKISAWRDKAFLNRGLN